MLLADFYRALGLRQVDLALNSIGTPADRAGYIDAPAHVPRRPHGRARPRRSREGRRPPDAGARLQAPREPGGGGRRAAAARRPVRRGGGALRAGAGGPDRRPGSASTSTRASCGASTTTRTPRSSSRARALGGAQNTIGGGGRYDGLVESLGGPPTPGIGFGSGIERVLATCDAEGVFDAAGRVARRVRGRRGRRRRGARDLTLELRRAGVARRPGLRAAGRSIEGRR